jgi:glycosyltransferase involved in cell wall biosynthesis
VRIVMSTSDFLPSVGGVASVVWELSKALAQRDHEVHIVHWLCSRRDIQSDEQSHGVFVHRVQLTPRHRLVRKLSWALEVSGSLRTLFGDRTPDVIHSHTIYPDGIAARLFPGKPLRVFTNHTSGFLRGIRSFRRHELSWMVRGFDCILAPSTELAELSQRCGQSHAYFISNGVDTGRFSPDRPTRAASRQELGLPASAKVILVPRRFEVKNGIRYIAQAYTAILASVPDAILVFCGPDCDRIEFPAVKRILADSNSLGRVRFEGAVPNTAMPTYYSASDLAVLPSLMEATSVSGLEAMATGLPLVATTVGGLPLIVQHERTGLLVPPCDSAALATAVIKLLLDERVRCEMGAAARQEVCTRFSWDTIAEQTETSYRTALGDDAATAAGPN